MVIELRVVQFWSEITLVISNRTRAANSIDFEITRMISGQIALHSVQLPLFLSPRVFFLLWLCLLLLKRGVAFLRILDWKLFRERHTIHWITHAHARIFRCFMCCVAVVQGTTPVHVLLSRCQRSRCVLNGVVHWVFIIPWVIKCNDGTGIRGHPVIF